MGVFFLENKNILNGNLTLVLCTRMSFEFQTTICIVHVINSNLLFCGSSLNHFCSSTPLLMRENKLQCCQYSIPLSPLVIEMVIKSVIVLLDPNPSSLDPNPSSFDPDPSLLDPDLLLLDLGLLLLDSLLLDPLPLHWIWIHCCIRIRCRCWIRIRWIIICCC